LPDPFAMLLVTRSEMDHTIYSNPSYWGVWQQVSKDSTEKVRDNDERRHIAIH